MNSRKRKYIIKRLLKGETIKKVASDLGITPQSITNNRRRNALLWEKDEEQMENEEIERLLKSMDFHAQRRKSKLPLSEKAFIVKTCIEFEAVDAENLADIFRRRAKRLKKNAEKRQMDPGGTQ